MKRRFSFLLTAIFLLSVGLCAVTGLSSCENFFNGAELKHEIDDAVAYANAQNCSLYLKSDSASGSFLSEGGTECKLGYTTDVQFTLNQNEYFFISLEAVSTTDESQSREDCVEFTINEKETDSYRGIYIITVKLLKYASDILIRPKCMEIPCITSHSPSSKSTQFANTPVVINFNVPMEDRETPASESLFNFENISIFYNDSLGNTIDMIPYFYEPEFNADKTVLTIQPIGAKIKKFIQDNQLNYVEINFSLSENIVAKRGEDSFSLRSDSVLDFMVRYNSSIELTPPECKDFFVTKHEITLDSVPDFNRDNCFVQKSFDDFTADDCIPTLVPSTFYIYGKFYDGDSGVWSIEVSEVLKKDIDDIVTESSFKKITTLYDPKSAELELKRDGNGYGSFVLKYTMQESLKESPDAGFFELSVSVKDACNNASDEKTFYVNYEEYNNLSGMRIVSKRESETNIVYDDYAHELPLSNIPFSKVDNNSDRYDFSKFYSDIKKLRIKDEYVPILFLCGYIDDADLENYDKCFISAEYVDYYCEYTDKNGIKRREAFTGFDADLMERSLVLDIDKVSDVSITIIVEYEGISIGRRKVTFPPKCEIYDFYDDSVTVYGYRRYGSLGILQYADGSYNFVDIYNEVIKLQDIPDGCKLYLDYVSNYDLFWYEFDQDSHTYYEVEDKKTWPNYSYSKDEGFCTPTYGYWYGLIGDLGDCFTKDQSYYEPDAPSWEYKLSQSQNGYIDVTLKFDLDVWDKYDSIELSCHSDDGDIWKDSTMFKKSITKNDTAVSGDKVFFSLPISESYFYTTGTANRVSIGAKGKKNYIGSEWSFTEIEVTEDQWTDFDNIKPSDFYDIKSWDPEKFTICFYDDGSGPESGKVWLNGEDIGAVYVFERIFYEYNTKKNQILYCKDIPYNKCIFGENLIKYDLFDKAGNETIGTYTFNMDWKDGKNLGKYYDNYTSETITFGSDRLRGVSNGDDISIFEFNESAKCWNLKKTITKDDVDYSSGNYFLKSSSALSLSPNKFYRIYHIVNSYNRQVHEIYDTIICATNNPGNSNYNYIIANGSSKNSVVISSSYAKALVRVCRLKQPLEVWQDVTAEGLDRYSSHVYEEVIDFSAGLPRVYDFSDVCSDIPSGDCYCIVAHFADGTCTASQVWKK